MKKIYIPIICGIALSLIGLVYSETKEEIAAKANNETIMLYIQKADQQRTEDQKNLKLQQKENREDRRLELRQQHETNNQILQSIQMMLIQRVGEVK